MSNLVSPDTFDFFARYLLAGLVIIFVRARFIVGERPRPADRIVEAVVLSLINQLLFYLLEGLAIWLVPSLVIPPRFSFFLEILVLPSLLGLLFGWNLSAGWNRALLRRFSMPLEHPIRRAHDFAFSQDRYECLVIVTYQDGTRIHGLFGEKSLAASDDARSDLYLERIYTVGEDQQWAESTPGRSVLLSLAGLRSIEFLDTERG